MILVTSGFLLDDSCVVGAVLTVFLSDGVSL